ncbi:MAG: ParB N-terminal domain-containing protein [Candidatus Pacearchaeota archaeon]|jgi:ParB-like chromosome segregation protein Spo0J
MKIYNEIKLIELSKIKPYFNNPRNNEKATQALVKIIPDVGFNVPLLVDKNLVIIKGHSRYHAAGILKIKKVPCIISENDDEKNNADRVCDNAINDLSEWNPERLSIELREIEVSYKDLFDFNSKFIDFENKIIESDFNYSKETKKGESLLSFNCPKCGEEVLLSPIELSRKLEINDKLNKGGKKDGRTRKRNIKTNDC